MDRRSLYDDDVYAWAKQQADALRRLARDRSRPAERTRPGERGRGDRGRGQVGAEQGRELHPPHSDPSAQARLRAASPRRSGSGAKEILAFRAELLKELRPSMWPNIDLDDHQWRQALLKVDGELPSTATNSRLDFQRPARSHWTISQPTTSESKEAVRERVVQELRPASRPRLRRLRTAGNLAKSSASRSAWGAGLASHHAVSDIGGLVRPRRRLPARDAEVEPADQTAWRFLG